MIYSWLKRDSIEIDDTLLSLDNEIVLEDMIKEINGIILENVSIIQILKKEN